MASLVFIEGPDDELSLQAMAFARGLGEQVEAVTVDSPDYAPPAWAQAIADLVTER